ncbi:retrovirus-related pol polyprotein from transposon TNT 1-94 [Tanacetum coccineum]
MNMVRRLKNKARLVAKGERQETVLIFEESFALVARLEEIRLFIAHTASQNMIIYQMDVKTAFLNGEPEMNLLSSPIGIVQLKKALYWTQQAPRAGRKAVDVLINSGLPKRAIKAVIFSTIKNINMGLWYPKDSGFELKAFADADYAGCHDTRRSTSGSAQFLGHRLVSWSSKKDKKERPLHYISAEYIAISGCCAQILWMHISTTRL